MVLCALALATLLARQGAAEESVRVRIAWGGSTARIWHGSISVDQGSLTNPCPLGIEGDEPGSMWMEDGRVRIRQPSGRLYDGLDLTVTAPVGSAKLRVELTPRDARNAPAVIEIPLRDALADSVGAELDSSGTRLLARRTPGDALRVRFERASLVFAPGEVFPLEVTASLLSRVKAGQCSLKATLVPGRGSRVLWEEDSVPLEDPPRPVSLQVPIPAEEGAYDLLLSVTQTPGLRLPPMGQVPLGPGRALAQRKVQFLVLRPDAPSDAGVRPPLAVVEAIDPANEKWWERFAKPGPLALARLQPKNLALARLWQGPLGSGDARTRDHALGRLTELGPGRGPDRTSWEAYVLPLQQPGRPHVLEIEYPSDVPQELGVSVMEPNAAGALMPIHLDSGVGLADSPIGAADGPPVMLRHRLVFWPRTKTPIVLVTNRGAGRACVYGKIRVLAGWDRLPPAFSKAEIPPERLLAAYLDRPLFPESFCAEEAYDPWSHRSLDDWTTFHEGGTRLLEYLQHVGLGGLMLSVYADGASIYPSQLLQPTPRYDKGAFFATGQDPVQKDVLEMLFRLFDRQQLRLIPAMEFSTPLPELEEVLRQGGPQSEGLRWIGPGGVAWHEAFPPHERLTPHYNLLQPRVQQAMLRVIAELLDRYAARHESLAGLAIQLSGRGFAVLPGPEWGLDDATVALFERETGLRLPSVPNADRFAVRAEFLLRQQRQAWLDWRAATVSRFYDQVQAELTSRRPGARLYLATGDLLGGPLWQERLRPSLSGGPSLREALLEVGLDTARFRRPDGPVLLHSDRIEPIRSTGAEALDLEAADLFDVAGRSGQWSSEGSLFYHPPRELRLESFDQKSPYRESYTTLVSQLVPSDRQNRRRFVHSLALWDSSVMFDGGRLLPMGQEDSIRDLVAIYRRLPAVRFRQLAANTTQPVTVRYTSQGGRSYIYVANDSPVAATVLLRVDGPPGCRLRNLADDLAVPRTERRSDGLYWRAELGPYDLAAVWLAAPDAQVSHPQVVLPQAAQAALDSRIRELGVRASALREPPALKVPANADFEQVGEDRRTIAGWTTTAAGEGADVRLERTPQDPEQEKPGGTWSARLRSEGPDVALVSDPLEVPATGRLSLYAWLRVPDPARQPAVELVISGRWHGRIMSPRVAVLGRAAEAPEAPAIGAQWHKYVFPVQDLPLEGLSDLRVAFQLRGPGEVWIDDVQLKHLEFKVGEIQQLSKMILTADAKLRAAQVGDCIRLLEGYWARFLEDNVPLGASAIARSEPGSPQPTKPEEPETPSAGLLDRMKGLVPKRLW